MPSTLLQDLFDAVTHDRRDFDITPFRKSDVSWLIRCGLGALLHHACGSTPVNEKTVSCRATLKATNLTARVCNGLLLDATSDVLHAAGSLSTSITLLKGISVCQDIYPQPHLRPMGDIDLLVEPSARLPLERLLFDLGYRQRSSNAPEFYAAHHHSMPFFHPALPVCIEVHTALFPAFATVSNDNLFSADHVRRSRVLVEFGGRSMFRLRPELQLAYISSHMAEQLTFLREPVAFIDILFLLRKYREVFDWGQLLSMLDGTVAATHVYVLLDYLHRDNLVTLPHEILQRLRNIQSGVNSMTRLLLHRILNRYLLAPTGLISPVSAWNVQIAWKTLLGPRHPVMNMAMLPWNILFPPESPDRYSAGSLLRRLGSLAQRLGGTPPRA